MTSHASRLGFVTLLFAFLSAGGVAAQESPRPTDEGLQVHGHWTITVVRDGAVVERREFENALMAGGQAHLTQLLSRTASAGLWTILVQADGTDTLCADNEFVIGTDTDCTISEAAAELTVTDNDFTVILEGSETMVRDANLELVDTHQWYCNGNTAPETCQPQQQERVQFTRKALDTPIAVQAGDRIEVTVEISFS